MQKVNRTDKTEREKTRSRLETEFVNQYRRVWNTNTGLSTKRIKAMTIRQLKASIESLKQFPK